MLRSNFSRLNLMGVVLILAACTATDQAVAPKQSRSAMPVGAPSLDVIMNSTAADSLSADFTVTPTGGMFVLGKHAVYFPDHAICDPSTSSYGPGHWDEPCTPLDEPIQFHAEIRGDSANGAWIDFSPSVRFVPTDDPAQSVWIMMRTTVQTDETNYQGLTLLWTPNHAETAGVNEALEDPSLKTYVDVQRSIVFRRIKHFTGYLVTLDRLDNSFLDDIIPIW